MDENISLGTPENLEPQEVEEESKPTKPLILLQASPNNMDLQLELQRTGTHTLLPEFDDVMQAIADAGIVFGINEQRIRDMCNTPRFNEPYFVARGKAAETGSNGFVDYKIETVKNMQPKIRPDGTVDYRDLGLIQNVLKGQVLCEIHPPQKGEDGSDIYGNILPGYLGKAAANVSGKNTVYSPDNLQLLADTDGSAEVRRGLVEVISLLKIDGNVDNSTGDIDFVGDVQIKGDVLSGFNVIAGGNIVVRGTVEGATLNAKGDISVNEGINGMNHCSITAGKNLKCKYIQRCDIKVRENIYADFIMYCNLECDGNVELSGVKAVLIGGEATISGYLTAKTLGTSSHIATHVTMRKEDKALTLERQQLEKRLVDIENETLKLNQIVNRVTDMRQKAGGRTTPEIDAAHSSALGTLKTLRMERAKSTVRLEEVKQEQLRQSRENNCYIECKDRVHSGVRLTFGPLNMHVQKSFVFSRICLVDNDIMITPLSGSGKT